MLLVDILDARITQPIDIVPFCKSTRIASRFLPTIQLFSIENNSTTRERFYYDIITQLNKKECSKRTPIELSSNEGKF